MSIARPNQNDCVLSDRMPLTQSCLSTLNSDSQVLE